MTTIIARSDVLIRWPTQQHVPLGGHYNVYRDAGEGVVDYAAPINYAPIFAWPDGAGKVGAGLGRAGLGAAGIGDGGIGAGLGAAGLGPAGIGAAWHEHYDRRRNDGEWIYGVVGFDAAGNPAAPAAATEAGVALAAAPRPPSELAASQYDDATDTLTITYELSPDDQ